MAARSAPSLRRLPTGRRRRRPLRRLGGPVPLERFPRRVRDNGRGTAASLRRPRAASSPRARARRRCRPTSRLRRSRTTAPSAWDTPSTSLSRMATVERSSVPINDSRSTPLRRSPTDRELDVSEYRRSRSAPCLLDPDRSRPLVGRGEVSRTEGWGSRAAAGCWSCRNQHASTSPRDPDRGAGDPCERDRQGWEVPMHWSSLPWTEENSVAGTTRRLRVLIADGTAERLLRRSRGP